MTRSLDRVLLVDLAGVAAVWHPERRTDALAELADLPYDTVEARVFDSGFDEACDHGRYDLAETVHQLGEMLGLGDRPRLHADLRAAWARCVSPDPEVLAVVAEADAPTSLFTNNGALLEDAVSHDHPDIAATFDRLLFSWRLGAAKPDPAAYAAVTDALGIAPRSVFFADDSEPNVDGARAAGWTAHHFTTVDALRLDLAESGYLEEPHP
ncbi:MAG: HAD family hydrolase [Acidimicrobiales bacterium]